MSTIDELMEAKEPGTVKIMADYWDGSWFMPHFKDKKRWFGLNDSGWADDWAIGGTPHSWQLYKEPVKMETRWLWADPHGLTTDGMYKKQPYGFFIKLEWSATEFPI